MSLMLAATVAAQVVPAAQIDLASPTIYISDQARVAIADGTVAALACLELPERSKKFRTACLTKAEWQAAAKRSAESNRRSLTTEAMNGLPYSAGPSQSTGYESTDPR